MHRNTPLATSEFNALSSMRECVSALALQADRVKVVVDVHQRKFALADVTLESDEILGAAYHNSGEDG